MAFNKRKHLGTVEILSEEIIELIMHETKGKATYEECVASIPDHLVNIRRTITEECVRILGEMEEHGDFKKADAAKAKAEAKEAEDQTQH